MKLNKDLIIDCIFSFIVIILAVIIFIKEVNITMHQNEDITLQKYENQVLENKKNYYINKGYKKVYYKLNKINQNMQKNNIEYNYKIDLNTTVNEIIVNKYSFYTTYYTIKVNNKKIFFKNKKQCKEFVNKIKKYTNKNYKIKKIISVVNKETKEKKLNTIIRDAEMLAQRRIKLANAKRKAAIAAAKKKKKSTIAIVKKKKTKKIKKIKVKGSKSKYKQYAHNLVINKYHWTEYDYKCLVKLWNRESGWNYKSYNRYSGAYGIPQALPGRKMRSAGSDWRTNGFTQIRWGLKYIKKRYGSPSKAWVHFRKRNWY